MYTTYKGYFQNGRFVSPELAAIPDNIEVHVTIIGDETQIVDDKTMAQRQNEALKQLVSTLKEIDDEPFDESIILNNRFNIKRELDL